VQHDRERYVTKTDRPTAPRYSYLLALNVLGAIGYLVAVLPSWAIPEER
jgi:hypothetical protein